MRCPRANFKVEYVARQFYNIFFQSYQCIDDDFKIFKKSPKY